MAIDVTRLPSFRWEPAEANRRREARRLQQEIQQTQQRLFLTQQERQSFADQTRRALGDYLQRESGLDDLNKELKKEAQAKQQSFLFKALSFLDRPSQVVRGVAEEMIWGGMDEEDIVDAIWAGLRGEGPDTFSEVLQRHGWTDTPIGLPGFLGNVSGTDVVGFGIDIAGDPLNLVPASLVGKGVRLGVKGAEMLPVAGGLVRGARTGLREAFIPLAEIENVKRLDPVTGEVVSARDLILNAVKSRDVAVYQAARSWKKSPFSKLDREELNSFWKLFGPTEGMGSSMARAIEASDQPALKALWAQAARQGVRQTDSLGTTIRFYAGEWEPMSRALGQKMGLVSELDNYMRHFFQKPGEAKGILKVRPDRLGFLEQRTIRGASAEALAAMGFLDDTELILKMDRADRLTANYFREARVELGERFGIKLSTKNIGAVPRDSYVFSTLDWRPRTPQEARLALQSQEAGKAGRLTLANFMRQGDEETQLFLGIADRTGLALDSLDDAARKLQAEFQKVGAMVPTGPSAQAAQALTQQLQTAPLVQLRQMVQTYLNRIMAGERGNAVSAGYALRDALRDPAMQAAVKRMRELAQAAQGTLGPQLPDVHAMLANAAQAISEILDPKQLSRVMKAQGTTERALRYTLSRIPRGIQRGESLFAVPQELGKALNWAFSPREIPWFLRQFDAAQAFLKGTVTSIWPAFHGRNAGGNAWNSSLLGGFDPKNMPIAVGAALGNVATFKGLSVQDEILPEMIRRGAWGSGRFSYSELRASAMRGQERPLEGMEKLTEFFTNNKKNPIAWAFMGGRTLGEFIENSMKLSHVMTRLNKGDDLIRAISGPNGANRAMFRYDISTPFMEQAFVRVFPFARWFTQNIPFQMERLGAVPAKFARIEKTQDLLTQREMNDAEIALAPDFWFEQLGGLLKSNEDGSVQVAMGIGLPAEDLNRFFVQTPRETLDNWMAQSSWFLKALLEGTSGHSFFTGENVADPAFSNFYRRLPELIRDFPGMQEWLKVEYRKIPDGKGGVKEVAYVGEPWKVWLLTTMAGRVVSTIGKYEAGFVEDRVDRLSTILNLTTGLKVAQRDLANPLTRATVKTERTFQRTGEELGFHARQYLDQEITLMQYNAARERIMNVHIAELTDAREDALAVDLRVDPSEKEALRRKKDLLDFARTNLMGPEMLAVEAYEQLRPQDFADERRVIDWDAFFGARDDALQTIASVAGPEKAQQVEKGGWILKMPPDVQAVEARRRTAYAALKEYRNIPRYLGFSAQEGERIYDVIQRMIAVRGGLPRGGAGSTLRAYRRMIQQGIATPQEVRLAQLATKRVNPQRDRFRRQHPEVFLDLFSDITGLEMLAEGQAELVA